MTHPYPGAFTFARHQKIMLWKAVLLSFDSNSVRNQKPGEIIRVGSKSIDVSTGDGIIRITKFSLEKGNISNVLFKDVIYQGQKLR